jgi:hypothetical protein
MEENTKGGLWKIVYNMPNQISQVLQRKGVWTNYWCPPRSEQIFTVSLTPCVVRQIILQTLRNFILYHLMYLHVKYLRILRCNAWVIRETIREWTHREASCQLWRLKQVSCHKNRNIYCNHIHFLFMSKISEWSAFPLPRECPCTAEWLNSWFYSAHGLWGPSQWPNMFVSVSISNNIDNK